MYEEVESVFTDGGLLGRNPCRAGGSWSFRYTDHGGVVVGESSGLVMPSELGVVAITNNHSELMAVAQAFDPLPSGWSGELVSDSEIILGWVSGAHSAKKAHPVLWGRVTYHMGRFTEVTFRHVKGHPNRSAISAGVDACGRQVSAHQHWCDEECNRVRAAWAKAA